MSEQCAEAGLLNARPVSVHSHNHISHLIPPPFADPGNFRVTVKVGGSKPASLFKLEGSFDFGFGDFPVRAALPVLDSECLLDFVVPCLKIVTIFSLLRIARGHGFIA